MDILALIMPEDTIEALDEPKEPELPGRLRYFFGFALAIFLLIMGLTWSLQDGPFPWPSLMAWSGTGVAWLVVRRFRKRHQRFMEALEEYSIDLDKYLRWENRRHRFTYRPVNYKAMTMAQDRFSDLPWYESMEEALADHPLTKRSDINVGSDMPPGPT